MSINWPLLKWGGYRLLTGRSSDIRSMACEVDELCPAEGAVSPPAIFPDGALDRITGLSPWRNWNTEHSLIAGGPGTHGATKAYLIEDVTLSGPFLYKKSGKSQPGYGDSRLWGPSFGNTTFLEEASLVSCYGGSRFFGPFLKDSLPLELLPPTGAISITMQTKNYGHEPGYRELFGLPVPLLVHRGEIRHLTIYDDFGQNSLKAARYQVLRDRVKQQFSDPVQQPPVGVYLKRGDTGESRVLSNEAAVEDRLAALGFDIVEPAALGALEIARRTFGASIVVSVEGSHMSHAVYTMAEKGALLVLQPPDRFAMAFKEFTDRIDLRFGFVVGKQTVDGFSVDLDEIVTMVNRLT